MNSAFNDLKKVLPRMMIATKMNLLGAAKEYITYLTELLQDCYKKHNGLKNAHNLRRLIGVNNGYGTPLKTNSRPELLEFSFKIVLH